MARFQLHWAALVAAVALGVVFVAHLPLLLEGHPESPPPERDWSTPAERSQFQSTPSYDETLDYLRALDEHSTQMELQTFGTTARGREMVVAVASGDRAFTPGEARLSGKPVVLLVNGIHPGEICGKDASLILLRELLVEDWYPDLLDQVVLMVVPVFNVDGHERADHRHSRANQDGPAEGMGFRTTATGMDLNRDFMKLETDAAQALVGGLIRRWDPHLVVDNHTTDGADHQYQLSYGMDLGPRVDPGLAAWTEDTVEQVAAHMELAGRPVGPYIFPRDWVDPTNGMMGGGWSSPRLSTSYVALRDRASILTEAHSFKPYDVRVGAMHDFLAFLLLEIAKDPAALTGAVAAADTATVAMAHPDAAAQVPLRVKHTESSRPFDYRTHAFHFYDGEVSGGPIIRYSNVPVTMPVDLYAGAEVELAVAPPAGYLIPPEYDELVDKLRLHGFFLEQIPDPLEVEVEMVRLTEVEFSDQPYQGRQRADVVEWEVETLQRTFPAGSWWLPLDQSGAKVAVHLLEPMAPDSFFSWGYLSRTVEAKEWFSSFVMEPRAQQMLDEDPSLLTGFEERLAEDPEFRANGRARLEYFYRKTEHADPDYRLHPVGRVLDAHAAGLPLYDRTATPSHADPAHP